MYKDQVPFRTVALMKKDLLYLRLLRYALIQLKNTTLYFKKK